MWQQKHSGPEGSMLFQEPNDHFYCNYKEKREIIDDHVRGRRLSVVPFYQKSSKIINRAVDQRRRGCAGLKLRYIKEEIGMDLLLIQPC